VAGWVGERFSSAKSFKLQESEFSQAFEVKK